jgi:23S rRNA pseudouridine2605 synthase
MKPKPRPAASSRTGGSDESSTQQRLQKVLAAAGVGSRRDCELYIVEGRVEVNRKTVTELGTKVNPQVDEIKVDGVALHKPKKLYFALNKPPGVVCTNFDPSQRMRVIDFIPTEERLFPVGRLDRGSEGLILVTNDGELANRVTHPRYGLEKTYFVRVAGSPSAEELLRLKRGVHLAEGIARVVSIKVRKRFRQHSDLEIVLNEGKNREIRRILARVGHKVLMLRRLAVGPIKLAELPVGSSRRLTSQEVASLFEATQRQRKKQAPTEEELLVDRRAERRAKQPALQFKDSQPTAEKKVEKTQAKPVGKPVEKASPKVPANTSFVTAPPKVDLAMLLNPHAAPKVAVAIAPPSSNPSLPSVGDVLDYDTSCESSVRGFASKPSKRALHRAANSKILAETEPPLEKTLGDEKQLPSQSGQKSNEFRERSKAQRGRTNSARGPKTGARRMPRGMKADARHEAPSRPRKSSKFKKRRK